MIGIIGFLGLLMGIIGGLISTDEFLDTHGIWGYVLTITMFVVGFFLYVWNPEL